MEQNQIKFKRILGAKGATLGISIPQELIEFLNLKDGDELTIIAQSGKKGKFLALFKE